MRGPTRRLIPRGARRRVRRAHAGDGRQHGAFYAGYRRALSYILPGADVFLRLSAAGVLPAQRLGGLATRPLIIALANPEPEIVPDAAKTARPDAIIATGRSDYPNQVNDVPVFPFVFRGALDVAARADQRANERCRRKRAGRACQGGAVRHCCPAACNPEPALRSGVPDSEAARPSARRERRASRGKGGDGHRRRREAERAFRRLPREAHAIRLSARAVDELVFQAAKKTPKRIVFAGGADERALRAAQLLSTRGFGSRS